MYCSMYDVMLFVVVTDHFYLHSPNGFYGNAFTVQNLKWEDRHLKRNWQKLRHSVVMYYFNRCIIYEIDVSMSKVQIRLYIIFG